MDIRKTFLSLTDRTYPYGTESQLFHLLPNFLETDRHGNKFVKIGISDVMFTSHLDTATAVNTEVNHIFDGDIVKTDGKSILGADDKAGVTIMLYMISKNIPGLYYFFLGEEVGCIGSGKLATDHALNKEEGINKVISFDRRGLGSIITFQSSSRCCSDTFGTALSKELNNAEGSFSYDLDQGGVYTDSAKFVKIYPECTNISVGYYSEHTHVERQDLAHLEKLAIACTKVDWNALPVERDPSKVEYKSYYYSSNNYHKNRYSTYDDRDDECHYPTQRKQITNEKEYFYDEEWLEVISYTKDKTSGKYLQVDIPKGRVTAELEILQDFLEEIEIEYQTIEWCGLTLTIHDDKSKTVSINRSELVEYLPELCLEKMLELADENSNV